MSMGFDGVVAFVNSIIIGGESVHFLALKVPAVDMEDIHYPEAFHGAVFVEPYPFAGKHSSDDQWENAVCSPGNASFINPVKLKMASLKVGMAVTVLVSDEHLMLEPGLSCPDFARQVVIEDIRFRDKKLLF